MLDFYLLSDDKNALSYPEEFEGKVVGNIDYQTFERLKGKKIIPEKFDYHSDFRWDTSLIRQIRGSIKKHALSDNDLQGLVQLLDLAKANGRGLIAFTD